MKKSPFTPYVENILEENEHLHIIAFCDDKVLAVDKSTGKAFYFYHVNSEIDMCCSMLCEVGERFQYWFKNTIALTKYVLGTGETEIDYFDTLIAPVYEQAS